MIFKLLITMLSLMITSYIVPGISITGIWPGLIAALILGLINILVKPIFVVFTFPLTILTLGLFLFVVNGIMLYLTSFFVEGFHISGIFAATIGAIILSLITGFLQKI